MEKKIPTTFEAFPISECEQVTPLVSKCRARIFYKGDNRNRGYITDEFAEELISTLPYVPVVGIYDKDKQDFKSHSRDRDEARIYGLVPENPNGEWVTEMDNDGVERTYYTVDIYLYTGRLTDASKIVGNPQSMELDANSIEGSWESKPDGSEHFVYTKAHFIGLSALGKDVEPCFEGAAFFDLVSQFGEYLSQSSLTKKTEMEGITQMDLTNFKFFENAKKDSVMHELNPNFSEEGGYAVDKIVCNLSEEEGKAQYALVMDAKTEAVSRYELTEDEEGKVSTKADVEPTEMYTMFTTEKAEAEIYTELSEKYSSFAAMKEGIAQYEVAISEKDAAISEKEAKIVELEEAKATYELEATESRNELQGRYDALKADYEALKAEADARALAEKEAKIGEYAENVSEAALNEIKENIATYSLADLEKELLFAMKNEKPDMFSKAKDGFAPASFVGNTEEPGIVKILAKYKNQ